MRKRFSRGLAAGIGLLVAACTTPSITAVSGTRDANGGSNGFQMPIGNNLVNNSAGALVNNRSGALVRLDLKPVQALGQITPYRIQGLHAGNMTPSVFRQALTIRIMDFEPTLGATASTAGHVYSLYDSPAPIDLAAGAASVSAQVNMAAHTVPEGTYRALSVEFGPVLSFAGQTRIGPRSVITKAATVSHDDWGKVLAGADTSTGPAEPFTMTDAGGPPSILKFAQPLVLTASSDVTIDLLYDLTGAIQVDTLPNGGQQFADNTGFMHRYIPMFAMVGTPPEPEYYDVTFEDPNHELASDSRWHYRMVLFANPDDGAILGMHCVGLTAEGGADLDNDVGNFVDTWVPPVRNPDGSYRMIGLNNMDPALIPQWEVDNFRRETHDGQAMHYVYPFGPGAPSPAPGPVSLNYHCQRVNR